MTLEGMALSGATANGAVTKTPTTRSGKKLTANKPCGHCNEECVQKDSFLCVHCTLWWHVKCIVSIPITPEIIDLVDKVNLLLGTPFYMCNACRKSVENFKISLRDQKAEIKENKDDIQTAELERQAMKEKIDRLEDSITQVKEKLMGFESQLETGMAEAVKEVKDEITVEKKDQEERAENIVIHGVPESEKPTGQEKKEEDADTVLRIAREIGVEIKGAVEAKFRAGQRRAEKPRPIIVKVTDGETRTALLRKAHLLKRKEEWKTVYVQPDLTFKQREEARKREDKLREEEREKNEEAKKEGRTGGRYVRRGWGDKRKVIWWWDTKGATGGAEN